MRATVIQYSMNVRRRRKKLKGRTKLEQEQIWNGYKIIVSSSTPPPPPSPPPSSFPLRRRSRSWSPPEGVRDRRPCPLPLPQPSRRTTPPPLPQSSQRPSPPPPLPPATVVASPPLPPPVVEHRTSSPVTVAVVASTPHEAVVRPDVDDWKKYVKEAT